MTYDLDDLAGDGWCHLPGLRAVINCNMLNVTISRDHYYLDWAWRNMKSNLGNVLMDYLLLMKNKIGSQVVLANLYILRQDIAEVIQKGAQKGTHPLVEHLANARVFQLNGHSESFSLQDIKARLTPGLPLFYSTGRKNLRWVGGNFRHDFIVLPEPCLEGNGAARFYEKLFTAVFHDAVDLDTIARDRDKLKELVDQGIVTQEALKPEVKIVGEKQLSPDEQALLEDIGAILQDDRIVKVIEDNLQLPIRTIRPVYFHIKENGAYISSGILTADGVPMDEARCSNFLEDGKRRSRRAARADVLLGLSLNHPFIRHLVASPDPNRAYFSLTFIANELALSQRLLVPYSPFFHLVKEKLAAGMREALIQEISERKKAA